MKKSLATLLLSTLMVTIGFAADIPYRYLGRIQTTSPAFVKVEKVPGQDEFLLISQFGALVSGKVAVIPGIKKAVQAKNFSGLKTDVLYDQFKWPNSVSMVPQDVFGQSVEAIVVPDGFLPPGKTEGNVYVMTTQTGDVTKKQQVYQISPSKAGYFYHTGFWIDIDGDGRKDYLTARSNAKAGQGQLVWYHHPETGLSSAHWEEHVVTAGPDVMFDIEESMPGYEGSLIVFASEFFNKKLTVYQIGLGAANGGQLMNSRVIDSTIDQAYSVKYLSLTGGKKQLLVNNHETDNSKAAIFTYDVPSGDLFGSAAFPRTTIASGFKNAFSLFIPNMSPGFPYAVVPQAGAAPHVLVAGDGDYSAHLLRPDASQSGGFRRELVKNLGGTVGSIAVYDFEGDGMPEFFVPNYDQSYIEVYQFYST